MVVSLGLLDWLDDDELAAFFAKQRDADFLHTFSERRGGLRQLLQRALRAADPVCPRFMELEELARFLPRSKKLFVCRDARLRDAVFVSSLPIKAA